MTTALFTESERLQALDSYAIVGTPPEPTFDELAALAARLCGMPQAYITFVEAERCSFKAAIGSEGDTVPATASICTLLVATRAPLLVPDATLDPRTRDRAAVTHGGVRFYAGVPLFNSDGHVLGALCVVDIRPRELAPEHLETLAVLGRQVVTQLDSRQQAAALRSSEERFRALVEATAQIIWTTNAEGMVSEDSPSWRAFTGQTEAEWLGKGWLDALHPDDRAAAAAAWQAASVGGERYEVEYRLRHARDGWRSTLARGVPLRDSAGLVRGWVGMNTDITARRAAEEAQRESAARLRLATEAAQLGIFVWHISDDRVEWENEQVYRQFGRTLAEGPVNAAEFAEKLIVPEDRAAFESAIAAALASEEPFFFQCRFVREDGALRWIEFHGRITRDAGGTPLWMLGTTAEITERKQAEEVLRESEARFRQIADTAPAMIWISDPQGQCTFLSRFWYDFTGTPLGSGLGLDWVGTVHPDDREAAAQIFLAANAQHRAFTLDYRVLRADGEYRWAVDVGRPRFGENGEYLGFIGTVFDIHERKTAEAALRESEARFREVADDAPVFIWMADPLINVTYVNSVFLRFLGLERMDQFVGRVWESMTHPDDLARVYAISGKAAQEQLPYALEMRLRHPESNEHRWIAIKGVPRYVAGEFAGFLGMGVDVHDRKLAESALREAKEQAESASRAKDNFLAALSHELRTPLTPVLMSAAAMREDESLPAHVRETLAMIERNVTVEARLIDDLLDLTRIAKGKLTLRAAPCDAHSLIGLAAEVVRDDARERQVAFEFDLGASRSHLVGDPARLQQVFWNLLRNAVKFSPGGGVVRIRSTDAPGELGQDHEGRLCIEVSDAGVGFDPVAAEHLFEPFEQAGREGDHRFGGLGLGLAIARAIVELHGGAIRGESAGPGRGATFTVELPGAVLRPTAANFAVSASEHLAGTTGDHPMRLLVVEDHEPTLVVLARLLTRAGHSVITADTAAAARTAAAVQPFDAVVSDLGLPDGTGLELMTHLRATYGMRGIVLSGYGMEDDIARSREVGFAAHLVKPVDFTQLRHALREIMAELPMARERSS